MPARDQREQDLYQGPAGEFHFALSLAVDELERLLDEMVERAVMRRLEPVGERPRRLPEVMSAKWLAEYLDCGVQRLYDKRSQGELVGFKEGGRLMYTREEVERYLSNGRGRRR